LAIQYSKATGFHTTGITRSKDIEGVARKLEADMVANNGEMLKQSDGGGQI
jgi:D-arabinose 1-dehydrogenase-like Zn-dependent alcohol dehydrogenase